MLSKMLKMLPIAAAVSVMAAFGPGTHGTPADYPPLPADGHKVYVCHKDKLTLIVDKHADDDLYNGHIGHGDKDGVCGTPHEVL